MVTFCVFFFVAFRGSLNSTGTDKLILPYGRLVCIRQAFSWAQIASLDSRGLHQSADSSFAIKPAPLPRCRWRSVTVHILSLLKLCGHLHVRRLSEVLGYSSSPSAERSYYQRMPFSLFPFLFHTVYHYRHYHYLFYTYIDFYRGIRLSV